MDELIRTALLLAALTQPVPPHAAPAAVAPAARLPPAVEDAVLGADKFQHFWVSFAVTSFAFAAATSAGQDTGPALTIAVPVGAIAGVGKEVYDRRRGGLFSTRDLVADALGIAAAWVLLREVR